MYLSPMAFIESVLDLIADLAIPEYPGAAPEPDVDAFVTRMDGAMFRVLYEELAAEHQALIALDWYAFLRAVESHEPNREGLRAALHPVRYRLGLGQPLSIESYLVPNYAAALDAAADVPDVAADAPGVAAGGPDVAAGPLACAAVPGLDEMRGQLSGLAAQLVGHIGAIDARDARETRWRRQVGVLGSALVALAAVAVFWLVGTHTDQPVPPQMVEREMDAGDVTVILSHTREAVEDSLVHMYMFNAGDQAQGGGMTLEDEQGHQMQVLKPSESLPARSVQRRVVKARKEFDVHSARVRLIGLADPLEGEL